MKNETNKSKSNINGMRILIASLLTFLVVMFALFGYYGYKVLDNENIYSGIYIGNVYVGKCTVSQAEQILHSHYSEKLSDSIITLKASDKSISFSLENIDYNYDISSSIEKAHTIGREGNIINRLYEVIQANINNVYIPLENSYDEALITQYVDELYDLTYQNVKEPDVLIKDDLLVVKTGRNGNNINKVQAIEDIIELIVQNGAGQLEIPIEITAPNSMDGEQIYENILREPSNASFYVENRELIIKPHIDGRSVDKKVLSNFVNNLEESKEGTFSLALNVIPSELTADSARQKLFRDTLATTSSRFYDYNENEKNRADNIRLTAQRINGLILAPGDVFSFNDVVGPRTQQAGFKSAHVYSNGKVIDDYGGGICQSSSALYNAVLAADLEVVERHNHMFTVGYVPLGRDATVAYGSVDFRFRNNTNWPIKIVSTTNKNNDLYFELKGTNETPWKNVVIFSETLKTIEFKEVIVEDPELPEGKTRVEQNGMNGFVVDTYKIIKRGDEVLSQKKLHTSTYSPLNKKTIVGTKVVEDDNIDQDESIDEESLNNMLP